jgi:hypothetical protein
MGAVALRPGNAGLRDYPREVKLEGLTEAIRTHAGGVAEGLASCPEGDHDLFGDGDRSHDEQQHGEREW